MKTSEQTGQLAKALAAAQGEFVNPDRNRTVSVRMKSGGQYTFDYATFDNILATTRPILAKNGLAVIQGVSSKDHVVTVTTKLIHESGEWAEDEISGRADDGSLQSLGSACTYLKRYSYTALLNIAAEEDDDGAAGSGHDADKQNRTAPKSQAKAKADKLASEHGMKTADQLQELTDAERAYVNDATGQIAAAETLEVLETIKAFLGDKPEHVKAKLRGLWAAKKKEIEGRTAA